ncbi:hypothetical protein WAK64_17765 [Bacillus spongiae]|uniref:Uncharacterized protein n=1 Tax=Bacillus spongiae TaxID=2683610 RepID=A0ABU8HI15_9BACI
MSKWDYIHKDSDNMKKFKKIALLSVVSFGLIAGFGGSTASAGTPVDHPDCIKVTHNHWLCY